MDRPFEGRGMGIVYVGKWDGMRKIAKLRNKRLWTTSCVKIKTNSIDTSTKRRL